MLSDSRYVDNVVLQKATLQALLTNIKNYPILDIEYIQEGEKDISTNLDVWENYTDGTPCVKITYGDETSLKGNVIFAETLKTRIVEAQRAIIEKTNTIADYQNRVSHWNKVYEVNDKIYQERYGALQAYGGNITAQAMDDKAALMALGQLIDDLKYSLDQSLSGSWWSPEPNHVYARFQEVWKDIKPPTANQYNYILAEETEDYNRLKKYYTKNGSNYLEYNYSTAEQWREDLGNHLIYKRYAVFVPVLQDRADLLAALNSTPTLTTAEANALLALQSAVTEYPDYGSLDVVNTLNTNITTIQQYVTTYINFVLNEADRKRQAALTAKNSLIGQSADLTSQIAALRQNINTWNDWIEKIATGEWKLNAAGNGIERMTGGTNRTMHGYKYVKVGSNIKFMNASGNLVPETSSNAQQANGTIRVIANGHVYDVPVKGMTSNSTPLDITSNFAIYDESERTKAAANRVRIDEKYVKIIGDTMTGALEIAPTNLADNTVALSLNGNTAQAGSIVSNNGHMFARGGALVAGTFLALKGYPGYTPNNSAGFWYDGTNTRIRTYNITANSDTIDFQAHKVYNAVFNDYAEYRKTINAKAGLCVVDNDDGSLKIADKRLMPGAQVISDTFGTCMGETDNSKTPLAVAGRVLVYPYRHKSEYHAGMAVCTAPDGTVDIMTREEIRDYPDCIVGIVSEIPNYTRWGSDNVFVDGRIWIKVK